MHILGTLFFSLVILRLGLTPACIPTAAQYRNRADANGGEHTGACRDLASLGTRGVFRLRSKLGAFSSVASDDVRPLRWSCSRSIVGLLDRYFLSEHGFA